MVAHLEISLKLLQQWRIVQALAEGSQRFTIPEAQADNLAHLRRFFDVPLEVGRGEPAPTELLRLNTAEPWSQVAGIRRTLIYPQGKLDRCRSMWKADRPFRFGFAGLDHRARGATLDAWHRRSFGTAMEPHRLRRGEDLAALAGPQEVAIVYSKKGRSFPEKVWDESYYRFLSDCTFTLCPNGEEIWTYRFFEAMLCGSMPVVESDCPAYHGFRYAMLSDTNRDAAVSSDDLEHNFALCRERLTIPREELNRAVPQFLNEWTLSQTS